MSALTKLSDSHRRRFSSTVALALGAAMLLGPGSAFAQSAPPPAQPAPSPTMAPMQPSPPGGGLPAAQPLPPAPPPGSPATGVNPNAPGAGQPMGPPGSMGPMPATAPVAPPPDPGAGPDAPSGYVPPADVQGGDSKMPAYIAFGVAGAGLIAGTALGIAALSAKSDYDDEAKNDPTRAQTLANKVDDRALLADTFFGAAIVAGVSGALFYFLDKPAAPAAAPATGKRAPKTQTGFQFAPVVSPRSQGAALTLRF